MKPHTDLPERVDTERDVDFAGVSNAGTLCHSIRQAFQRSAPEPLRRAVPAAQPYPIAQLGPILGPALESLRRVIQAPDAICAASLLAAASLAAQGLGDIALDGRKYSLSLWLLSIADSGERKSAVDNEAMRPIRAFERKKEAEYAEAIRSRAAEQNGCSFQRNADKAPLKGGRERDYKPSHSALDAAAPLLPTVIVSDFTAEGLAKLLAIGRPSIGAFTDEAGLVFGGHGMNRESVMRTAATLCKLWDCGELDRVRSGDGVLKLHNRRLALHLMAQPVIAEKVLSDDILTRQGFLARCLLAWPESTAGHRKYVAESLREDHALNHYAKVLSELM
ncbi:MAG: hypothetical protein DDT34_02034 [Firmicutes bacterium]|nr:hypothetical protein [Bacillota bacterium]